jgi:hypothetical protein
LIASLQALDIKIGMFADDVQRFFKGKINESCFPELKCVLVGKLCDDLFLRRF